MNTIEKDVVIIGGGISGLATATRLKSKGLRVAVLEKQARPGGAILTENHDGFLVDCGPNSTLETSPEIREFVDSIGLAKRRVYANEEANRRYILRGGKLRPLPMSPPAFLLCNLFSWKAKLRLCAEPFISPAPEEKEETVAEFVRRRLGQEFLDYAINPFIAGVYAGDPDRLSVRSAVAKIYALEKNYGSLIKGAIKGAKERKQRAEVDKTKARLFSFRGGMTEIVDVLSKGLGDDLATSASLKDVTLSKTPAQSHIISFEQNGSVHKFEARSVVFTTPAAETAKWVSGFAGNLSGQLEKITYPPVMMVFLGFKNKPDCRALDGFGFLVPKVEDRKILGTIWSSTIFPGRAPDGGAALTTFVGGMRQPEFAALSDDQLTENVLSELHAILDLKNKPDLVRIKRWRRAIPQYELGHQQRMQKVEQFEKAHPGVYLSGNFRNGISVGDCIVQSRVVADNVCDRLKADEASLVTS